MADDFTEEDGTLPLIERFGYTVFCDDIRREIGGKLTYVGIYTNLMLVNGTFPYILPKFGFGMYIFEKLENYCDKITLRIYLPGDKSGNPSIEAEMPADQVSNPHPSSVYRVSSSHLVFSPVLLKEPGIIRVRALCGKDIMRIGGMRIEQAQPKPTVSIDATHSGSPPSGG